MRAVGRQVVQDGLLVADVDEKALKQAALRVDAHGRHQAALQHVLQQAGGLQAYRLAACVGAADDEDAVALVELQVQGDDLLALGLQLLFQ